VLSAPLRGRGALAVLKWSAQCHGADTGLVAQSSTVAGMGFPKGVGGIVPGRDSQARDGATLLCQSIKCSYPRARADALEPRARRSMLEGGAYPRARRRPLEGVRALERGGPRSRERLAGPPWWAAGATAAWAVPCVRVSC
jgi:hypothetical protein